MDKRAAERARRAVARVTASATDSVAAFCAVTPALRAAVPADTWCGITLDPATMLTTGGAHHEGLPPAVLPRLLAIEYGEADVMLFTDMARQDPPVGVLREATGKRPERSVRYRDVLEPSGMEHEARLVFRDGRQAWGALVLMREPGSPPFGPDEAEFLTELSAPLARMVRQALLRGEVERGGLPDGPGLLILSPDHAVESVTPTAERWLADLVELRPDGAPLPYPVFSLAAQAAADDSGQAARARARTRSGMWLTLHAWRLAGSRVAVTLELSQPHELTALVLDACGLSAREREVAQLALLGYSTAEIAGALFVSPYTVQDHLKAVFDKTGVRSRRELAAQLFFRHYLPRIERSAPVAANGWFDES
ncbi:helix-turn-helix transcriptional regulator [Thermoactinospora rubra]|uniref:helix-turn-helix transcriptional regulator n=1 Tax=Thermoactinospora rubra TaxID=1088767 RepID=UPI000A123158|nr:helix-turn-helix transcriptional regulator [Thermoactinospora rubra]